MNPNIKNTIGGTVKKIGNIAKDVVGKKSDMAKRMIQTVPTPKSKAKINLL